MARRFTKIPQSTFEELQMDAGIVLKKFDVSKPEDIKDEDIVTATSGGITVTCSPSYSDFFEDVDNAPNNTKEGKHLDGWDCSMSFTALSASADMIKMSLGAVDAGDASVIKPRSSLSQSDFNDIWWVGDKAGGGMVAVRLINALSTGGFSLKTSKNGKGELSVELTGHASIQNIDIVPMEFYSVDAEEETGA